MADALRKINELLADILPANRFYAAKLAECAGPFDSLGEFSARVPFTTKEELAADRDAHPPLGTTHTWPTEGYSRYHQTSGTSGRPLVWLDDEAGWDWVLDNWEWVWRGAGVGPGDRALFPFSFGPFLGFWAGFEAAARMGVRAIPGGGLSSMDRLRLLQRSEANVLCCTPTYALRLAEVGRANGLDVDQLGIRELIVCGEPGGSLPAVRERIESAWNARVFDHHGMTEVGPVTVSDEHQRDLLRIRHEAYFAEVVDDAGQPVDEGDEGELVLTTLGRNGSPLIRYRTGDLVRPVATDEGIALRGGIIGRADDMVVVRGVNLYPSAVEAVVRETGYAGEYRVEVDQSGSMGEVAMCLCGTPPEARKVEEALRTAFSLRIPVAVVEELPVFEVKAKRWVVKGAG